MTLTKSSCKSYGLASDERSLLVLHSLARKRISSAEISYEISTSVELIESDDSGMSFASFKESINTTERYNRKQLTNRQTKPLGWDAMKHRNAVRAGIRNSQIILWAETHTLQDLADLATEMSGLGEDVNDIERLLNNLVEIDRSLQTDLEVIPGAEQNAEIAG